MVWLCLVMHRAIKAIQFISGLGFPINRFALFALHALRFCLANVVSFGQNFFELILHSAAFIKSNLEIIYGEEPKKSWAVYAHTVLRKTVKQMRDPKYLEELPADVAAARQEQLRMFLCLFNGDWRSPVPRHYCSMSCPCGGLPKGELLELAASTYCQVVLCSRPPIPALSRWLKCAATARWYMPPACF